MIAVSEFISHAELRLSAGGSEVRRDADFPGQGLAADLYAHRTGWSLWLFFPYDDFYFFHDFSRRDTGDRVGLEVLHECARRYVDSLFSTPRWLRYRVPNINTVAVSERGFGVDLQRYVFGIRPSGAGGERHSVFLVDLVNRRLAAPGLEATSVDMMTVTFKAVNPHNRAFLMIKEIFDRFNGA